MILYHKLVDIDQRYHHRICNCDWTKSKMHKYDSDSTQPSEESITKHIVLRTIIRHSRIAIPCGTWRWVKKSNHPRLNCIAHYYQGLQIVHKETRQVPEKSSWTSFYHRSTIYLEYLLNSWLTNQNFKMLQFSLCIQASCTLNASFLNQNQTCGRVMLMDQNL